MNILRLCKKTYCISCGALFVLVLNLQAAIFEEPSWKNEAGATQTYYTFETAANPPVALETNLYGSAMALIDPGTEIGWQSGSPINYDSSGCWVVSSEGFLQFTVPVSFAVLEPFTFEFMIDVITYEAPGLWISPSLTLQGDVVSEDSDFYSDLIAEDSFFGGGSWNHNVTTGTVEMAATATTLDFRLEASSAALAIQDVAIYTRAIAVPEPAVITLILGGSGLLLLLKRRFQ